VVFASDPNFSNSYKNISEKKKKTPPEQTKEQPWWLGWSEKNIKTDLMKEINSDRENIFSVTAGNCCISP
jgi:hypothetical protein